MLLLPLLLAKLTGCLLLVKSLFCWVVSTYSKLRGRFVQLTEMAWRREVLSRQNLLQSGLANVHQHIRAHGPLKSHCARIWIPDWTHKLGRRYLATKIVVQNLLESSGCNSVVVKLEPLAAGIRFNKRVVMTRIEVSTMNKYAAISLAPEKIEVRRKWRTHEERIRKVRTCLLLRTGTAQRQTVPGIRTDRSPIHRQRRSVHLSASLPTFVIASRIKS